MKGNLMRTSQIFLRSNDTNLKLENLENFIELLRKYNVKTKDYKQQKKWQS